MTHFGEFVDNHKYYVVCTPVSDTFWQPSNKVHGENVKFFCGDRNRLKLPWLLPTDQSSSLTNQAGSIVRVHLFVHFEPEVFVAECVVCFLGSHVTRKGVIMVFFQDFYLKGFNLGYIQYGSFVEELSPLRPVAEVNIKIRI